MAEPISFDLVFDEAGNPHLPDDLAARLSAQLGRAPQPGTTVRALAIVEGDDEGPEGPEVEHWLRTEVVAAYDAMRANPERGISAEEARAHFAA